MVDHQAGSFEGAFADKQPEQGAAGRIWILVDHSAREAAFESVARELEKSGIETQIVTITEVIGTMAREVLAGGAERLLRGLRVAVKGRGPDEDLIGAVRRARPDVLAITNARYVRALGLLENLTGIPTLQLGVLPDYNLSTLWLNSALQAYVVPHEEQKQRLVQSGVLADRILVAGPAIQPGFSAAIDRDAVRAELGMADQFVVLVRADGFDPAVIEKLVFQCTLVDRPMRFVFHHNGDSTAAAALRRGADQYRLPAAMFGKVDDLERYFAAADAVIASPQEAYLAELVAVGRPLLIVGNDENYGAQLQFLAHHGVLRAVSDVLRLGSELDRFATEENLNAMAQATAEVGSREGSRQIADALKIALANVEQWRVAPAVQTPQDAPANGSSSADQSGAETDTASADTAPSPFESIGTGQRSAGSNESATTSKSRDGATSAPEQQRDYSGISQAEAKEQLAQLILIERDLERRMGETERQQQRWRNRLELAREWNEEDLASEAEGVLRGYLEEAKPVQRELDDVRRQKEKLKQAAHGARQPAGPAPGTSTNDAPPARSDDRASEIERRFQRIEVDSDLKGLKDRIKRELGE
ncbi:MAG: hypothetical protein H0U74_19835 [Bradymonadaceae bacterium]|nr:hypothetical protein [Lujinxingiaceae bacterium]